MRKETYLDENRLPTATRYFRFKQRIEEYVNKEHIWKHIKADGTKRTSAEVATRAIMGFLVWDSSKRRKK